MLTIARTLMGNPQAILLDEPSEGLSPLIVEQMARAIGRMREEGIAVLVSEQNLAFAAAAASRALIIDKGRIVFDGPMTQVTSDSRLREQHFGL
jgi:branched-chain amino acid transport system ATP-binding protein